MAQKTDAELLAQKQIIKTETVANANTATRIGQMHEDVIDSKINNDKIIDEDNMSSNSASHIPTQQSVKAYVDAAARIPYGATSGTNTYTIAATPAVTAYADGAMYHIRVGTSSTGVITLNFDSVGAKKVLRTDGGQASSGHFLAGVDYIVAYNSALDTGAGAFVVVNELQHGLMNMRGVYDASANAYPSVGGSGVAGAVRHGDTWIVSVAGTVSAGVDVNIGDMLTTGVDVPGQTASLWYVIPGKASLDSKVDEETFATLTFASPVAWDQNNRQMPLAKLVATGAFTLNMTNVKSGAQGVLQVEADTLLAFVMTFDTDFTNKDIITGATLTNYTFPANDNFVYTNTFVVDGTTIWWIIGDYLNPSVANPYAKVRRAATQVLPTADVTNALSFDTEDVDNAAIFDAGSPTLLTIPGSGNKIATVTAYVDFAVNTTGVRRVWIYLNGAAVTGYLLQAAPVAVVSTALTGTVQIACAAGDTIEIRPYQNSGGNLNITGVVTIKIENR